MLNQIGSHTHSTVYRGGIVRITGFQITKGPQYHCVFVLAVYESFERKCLGLQHEGCCWKVAVGNELSG
jgi:hypothetical protein